MEPILGVKTISFETNGGSPIPKQTIIKGEKVTKPSDPVKEGYDFLGWYEDDETFTEEWNFNEFASADLTLYANWTASEFNTIELRQNPKLEYVHGDSLDLSGLIINFKYDNGSARAVYFNEFDELGITTNPPNGTKLSRSQHNGTFVEISYNGISIFTASLTVNPIPILNAEINVYSPATGEAPDFTANGNGHFTIESVTWSPNDNPFLGSTRYTVTVTLKTESYDYAFTELTKAVINGQTAVISNNTGELITLSYEFNPTGAKAVKEMHIIAEPNSLIFSHGDLLDLTGLVLRVVYNDDQFDDVTAADFSLFNIHTSPETGLQLNYSEDNNKKIKVLLGHHVEETIITLTIGKRPLTVQSITHSKLYDGNTNMPGDVKIIFDNILEGDEVFSAGIEAEYTSPDAGTKTINISEIFLGGSSSDNYTVILPVNPFTVIGGIKENGEYLFTFNVDEVSDSGFVVPSVFTLYRSAGVPKEITITGENINSVEWYYGGVEITGSAVSNNGKTITLTVSDSISNPAYYAPYNIIGKHLLTVIITKNNVPYSGRIEFEVKEK